MGVGTIIAPRVGDHRPHGLNDLIVISTVSFPAVDSREAISYCKEPVRHHLALVDGFIIPVADITDLLSVYMNHADGGGFVAGKFHSDIIA